MQANNLRAIQRSRRSGLGRREPTSPSRRYRRKPALKSSDESTGGSEWIEIWVAEVGRKVLGAPPVRDSRESRTERVSSPKEAARRGRRVAAEIGRTGLRVTSLRGTPRSECHSAPTAQVVKGFAHDGRCSGQGIGFALNRAPEEVSWRFGSNVLPAQKATRAAHRLEPEERCPERDTEHQRRV